MATSCTAGSLCRLGSRPRGLSALLAGLACVVGALVGGFSPVCGESISAANFKIDISSNMAWIDNKNPAVGLKLWRQTAMEQAVLASRPYVRVTNNSAGGVIDGFQLNLLNRDGTAINACLWDPNQQGSQWKWNKDTDTAFFNFANPIQSGTSFTIRLGTGPQPGDAGIYSLQQNYFAPGPSSLGGKDPGIAQGYGILGLTVRSPAQASLNMVSALAAPMTLAVNDPGEVVNQFTYSLENQVIDPYKTFGQEIGITIQPVPEPSGLALLAASIVSGGLAARCRRWALRRR